MILSNFCHICKHNHNALQSGTYYFCKLKKGARRSSAEKDIMDTANFAKGMGVGLMVGSAVGMAVISGANQKKNPAKKKSPVGKALKTMGDIVDNIGESMGM